VSAPDSPVLRHRYFDKKFEPVLLDLIKGVFAHCLLYDTWKAEEADKNGTLLEEPVLNTLCDRYPDFARHFLASLKPVNAKG
jgi:hypothetical protein